MFENEIMKPGERLKKIRELYNITQYEITNKICSRTNLSKIENGNQKLSLKLANLFTNRFNEIIEKKGVYIKSITADFLIKDENEQANDIFVNILRKLEENETIDLDKKLTEAEDLIKNYEIADDNKIRLYEFMTDIYYNQYKYIKSNEMCNKGIKICVDSNKVREEVNLYIYKSMNSVKTIRYSEALKELDYAELLNQSTHNSEYELIMYQRGLIYKKMCQYDKALEYFKVLIEKPAKDKKILIKAKMVYANCLLDQCIKFEEAQKEYFEILDLADGDKDFTALAYKNLAELYYNHKKYKEAGIYILSAQIDNNEYLNEILYFAAKVFQKLNQDFEGYLLKALKTCEQKDRENIGLIKNIIDELVLLYIKRNDEESLMLIADKAMELNIDYCLSFLRISEHFRGRNEKKSIEFINKLIDKLS